MMTDNYYSTLVSNFDIASIIFYSKKQIFISYLINIT